ncbi:MAG: SAM-dependent methyltransferase [Phycisphaeraceae bacterium]|nr:SAM-dependent methyltransferase [Phycisphaeraceae bacterium]
MREESPSKTARKVALNIVTLGATSDMGDILPVGIVDATATLLVASGAVGATGVRWSRSPKMVSVYRAFDGMMPGQFEAFAHRKAFCEHQVREGIGAGAAQVLVLGAGYDTIGWRLAQEFVGVNFFEIDHPATARLKAKGINAMGTRANLQLMAEDLGKRQLVDVLHANETWSPTAPTVIVAEGLLMYLPPDAVAALFTQCAAISGPGSRIAFTHIGTRSDGRPEAGPWTRLVLWILKVSGEPWLWSVQPEALGPFLKDHHWTIAPDLVLPSGRCGVEYFGVAVK